MTVHTPQRCTYSVMSQFPAGSTNKVILVDTGNYPFTSNYLNNVWGFSGTDWTQLSPTVIDPNAPLPGRVDGIMGYDGTNLVVYGGRGASAVDGVLSDTWTFNGTTWTKKTPATSPFGRYKAECAYLAGTGTVMFGGRTINDMLLETWIWNDVTWAQVAVANGAGPAARVDHCMDAGSGQVILFGGSTTNSQLNDTWSFNGTTWTKKTPATSPSVRSQACMSFSSAGGGVWVMFGGQNTKNYLDETWVYNGTTWTQVSIGAGPSGRVGAQMAYDANSSKVILFGGVSATHGDAASETWAFNAVTNTWAQL